MSSAPAAGPPKDLPAIVGGYRLIRELGQGRLGRVVLARRPATRESVALRIIKPEWSCLPKYVARLTRTAFAAAHVDHPNMLALVDFGEAQGRVYFAAEFVDGASLAEILKGRGPLTAPRATAHVLQAARGLRFAHGQGLAHGDVRPETILVDDDGRTRLADLGLTATPASVDADEARESKGPIAVGAEAQAEADAAPFRADVRALGLTLARLLTGKADAHPTALVVAGLPMNLVELIRGLAEAKPGGAFDDMGKVVPALERFLNGRGTAATTPREDDAAVMAECVRAFRASPSATLRRRIVLGAVAACAVMVLLGLLARKPLFAGSVLGLGLMTALADFVVAGLTGRSPLFPKVRALVLESRGADWLIGLASAAVFAAALVALNLHVAWIAFGILAVIAAACLHIALDGKIAAERGGAVEEGRALVKRLRLQGVDEESLRRFVRATAGDRWEEFFEAVFGFDAVIDTRDPAERGLVASLRRRSFPWREAVASWVDARRKDRRRERDRALLQAIEERGLVAEGVNLLTARRRSRRISAALLAVSDQICAASRAPGVDVPHSLTLARAVRQAVEAPDDVLAEREGADESRDYTWILDLVFGPRTRFLVGSALLAGFLLWVHQNEVVSGRQITDVASRALDAPDPLQALRGARIDVRLDGATRPLRLAVIPSRITDLFNGFNAGVAGLVLVISSFLSGSRVGLFVAPGAALAFFGPAFGVAPNAASAIGAGVAALGLFFGKSRDD